MLPKGQSVHAGSLTPKLDFLETINSGVKVEINVDAVGDENAIMDVFEPLCIELLELLEE